MTLLRLRLLLRDSSAAAAFGSMAISGEVPLVVSLLFSLGILLALLNRRPLARGGGASLAFLAVGGLALYGGVATGQLDLVVAACSFAGLIALHRLLAEPGQTTDGQVLLTSLLMLAGGAALSAELAYAACLALYAVLSTLALGLNTLEAHLEPGEPLPLRPAVRTLGLGAVAALVGAVLFFALFPRLSWNVAARKVSRGLGASAGFAGQVRLGDARGELKSSPRIVARVRLQPDPQRGKLEAYWRGSTLDTFDGRAWAPTAQPGPLRGRVQVGHRRGSSVNQHIELLPAFGSRTAIALDTPVAFWQAVAHNVTEVRPVAFQELPGEEVRFASAGNGFTYKAMSTQVVAPLEAAEVEAEAAAEREARERALPARLDPRIVALAKRVVGDASAPREAATRLERYLQSNYRYSLDLGAPSADPLAAFLFERKEGHCEYFATALAVLLRSAGFRARLVTGFFGGERNGDAYVLRAGDAHAWTEVYDAEHGYLRFDASPAEYRSALAAPFWSALTTWVERLESRWRTLVVEYSLQDQAALANRILGSSARGRPRLPGIPWKRGLVSLVAGVAAYVLIQRLRLTLGRGQSASNEALRLRSEIEAALQRAEPARLGEPLEEACARVRTVPVQAALRRYLEARFGEKALTREEREYWVRKLRASAPADTR